MSARSSRPDGSRTSGRTTITVPGGRPRSTASITISASARSSSSWTRWIPPMPMSTTRTSSGAPPSCRCSATYTPKPSSRRRTLPTPATTTRTWSRIRAVDALAELEARVGRYDGDRYPVQRATALFHLGSLLIDRDGARAREALSESVALFERAGLVLEAAKARNALGVALREVGELKAAAGCFRDAAGVFADRRAHREEAAAVFNLGLVTRSAEALERARAAFERV